MKKQDSTPAANLVYNAEWRPITDWPGYEVSSHGTVRILGQLRNRNFVNTKLLTQSERGTVTLKDATRKSTPLVANLYAAAFGSNELPVSSEEWRAIPDAPNYYASNLGRIKSGNKILKLTLNNSGYLMCGVKLTDGTRKTTTVQRMILSAFDRAPLDGEECDHEDFCRTNNVPSNLSWKSRQQNMERSRAAGNFKPYGICKNRGSGHGMSKLNEDDVLGIKLWLSAGYSQAELARTYAVSYNTIHLISKGRTRIKFWNE